jgi:hypothetical protein
LEEKRKEEEKRIKKFDTDINLKGLLKYDRRYLNVGKNKNYIIVKRQSETIEKDLDEERVNDDDENNYFAIELSKFKRNKRIIKAYENMKIINENLKSSLGLVCPRHVRNFERYDNRNFYKAKETNSNNQINETQEVNDSYEHMEKFNNLNRKISPQEPPLLIKKKTILPKIL